MSNVTFVPRIGVLALRSMTPSNRFLPALVVIVASLSFGAWAKCPTYSVEIRGKAQCSFKPNYKVLVTLLFRKNQPEGFGEENAFDLRDDSFQGGIRFSTFTSYDPLRGHRCNRRPNSVLIRFISGDGEEWDRKMLSIHDDFLYNDEDGSYHLRSPLVLHGWCDACSKTTDQSCN